MLEFVIPFISAVHELMLGEEIIVADYDSLWKTRCPTAEEPDYSS